MKKLFSRILVSCFVLLQSAPVLAAQKADDPFVLIPEAKDTKYTEKVLDLGTPRKSYSEGDKAYVGFREKYNKYGDDYTGKKDLGSQLASGIVTWDTILLLLTQVVKFIANGALIVGAAMVVYAGYLYVSSVYAGDQSGKANDAIKNAVIGIVIVIFSYAIQRIVTQAFLT